VEQLRMSYSEYSVSRWETPVSDDRDVGLEKLFKSEFITPDISEDNSLPLIIVLRNVFSGSEQDRRFRFLFHHCIAFKLTNEGFVLRFLSKLCQNHPGTTAIVTNSPWIAELREDEWYGKLYYASLQHYMILTLDYVIEVVAIDPLVEQIL
jgi:hypothetical protein